MATTYLDRFKGSVIADMGKQPVDAATTGPISLTGYQTVDGIALTTDYMRCLVKNQADETTNGIYVVFSGEWLRAGDFAGPNGTVCGQMVMVTGGTVNAGLWQVTTPNPIQIDQSGGQSTNPSNIIFAFASAFVNPPNGVDSLQLHGSASASPVAYVSLNAIGTDPSIGVDYKSKGTTTAAGQFLGQNENGTGRQRFWINNVPVLQLTDSYWNPDSYVTPQGYPVLSSGGQAGAGGDLIGAVYSVEPISSSIYNTGGTGLFNGLTQMYASKGPQGAHHFLNNGAVGHVSINVLGANPNGQDAINDPPNILWLSGTMAKSGTNARIYVAPSGQTQDINVGLQFLLSAGPFDFVCDGASGFSTFKLLYTASPTDYLTVTGSTSNGAGPTINVGSSQTNASLNLACKGNANVNIQARGQGVASFNSVASPASFLLFTNAASGSPYSIANESSGAGGLSIYNTDNGPINFGTNNFGTYLLSLIPGGDVVPGQVQASAIATNATKGFLYVTTCAGAPTGAPTNTSAGMTPIVYDTTNHKIWFYDHGTSTWKGVSVT